MRFVVVGDTRWIARSMATNYSSLLITSFSMTSVEQRESREFLFSDESLLPWR